jgi:hypothetical protein
MVSLASFLGDKSAHLFFRLRDDILCLASLAIGNRNQTDLQGILVYIAFAKHRQDAKNVGISSTKVQFHEGLP